jgi:hypothetical protein
MTSLFTEGVFFVAGPDSISLNVPGRPVTALSMRSAMLLRDSLLAAISTKLLPTGAFRWVEPTQDFKLAALLICDDPSLAPRFSVAQPPPIFRSIEIAPTSRVAGMVIQQKEEGQSIPVGHYIAAAGPMLGMLPSGYLDFEDAQAAVCNVIKGLLGIPQ